MLKVEIYKVLHSLNLLFLSIIIIPVALFLGFTTLQMNIITVESIMSMVFVSSSAVIMLYLALLASTYVNRDYASNNYRVLVGIGISRSKIIFSKYVVFLVIGILIIGLHALFATTIPFLFNNIGMGENQYIAVLAYIMVYASIISTMFLVAVFTRTLIRSILINIVYIILSSVFAMLLGSNNFFSLFFPIQSLQCIANSSNGKFYGIIFISLLYMVVKYRIAHYIFSRQEL